MNKKQYQTHLQNPLWKSKRKEILERDNYTCVKCGATSTLEVHHLNYKGKPWEVPNAWLITVCKECHTKLHEKKGKKKYAKKGATPSIKVREEIINGL